MTMEPTMPITTFDYAQLDASTAEFLREKERNMREIVGRAYTDLGRELKDAQDRLAGRNQYDGFFERWFLALGLARDTVYRLVRRYELIANCDDQTRRDLLEDLPVSLSYAISSPSADPTAKQAVLSGEVKTLKEYRALEAALKAEQQARLQAESTAALLTGENGLLRDTVESLAASRTEPTVEYVPDPSVSAELDRYRERFGPIDTYESAAPAFRIPNVSDVSASVQTFTYEVRTLLKKYAYLTQYARELTVLPAAVREDYEGAFDALGRFADELRGGLDTGVRRGSNVINL